MLDKALATNRSAMPSGGTYFVRTPDGQLLSERTPSGTYYYLTDALGSVMALTNSAGAVVNTYACDPYGYGGQQLDSVTGQYKMGQRYYDLVLPRWQSQDLLAGGPSSPQSFNRYSSVLGNPVSLLDAAGLCVAQGFIGPDHARATRVSWRLLLGSASAPHYSDGSASLCRGGHFLDLQRLRHRRHDIRRGHHDRRRNSRTRTGGASLFWTVNSVAGTAAGVMGCLNGW